MRCARHWRDIRCRFGPYVRRYRGRLSGAMSLVALVGMAVAVMPLFPKYVIDVVIPQRMIVKAVAAGGCYILVMYVRMGLWFAAMRQVYFVQQSIIRDLRKISFQHLQHLSLNFHNQYPSGFLYERVFGNSINTLGGFLAAVFQQLATYAVGLLFSLGFCLYLRPPLIGVIVVGALGYVVAARRLSKTIYRKTRAANEAGMRVVGIIMDKLRGVKTVQASAMEAVIQREFESELWPTMRRWMDAMLAGMKLSFVTEGLSYLITSVVIVGGVALVIHGEGTVGIGTLVAFMGYQGTLIGMMQALTNMYGQFMSAKTAFDQLYTVLDTMPSVADASGAAMPREIRGELAFVGVTFAYEPGKPVSARRLAARPYGQSVALVGRSGSGKTTLVQLLNAFHDPQAGRITPRRRRHPRPAAARLPHAVRRGASGPLPLRHLDRRQPPLCRARGDRRRRRGGAQAGPRLGVRERLPRRHPSPGGRGRNPGLGRTAAAAGDRALHDHEPPLRAARRGDLGARVG